MFLVNIPIEVFDVHINQSSTIVSLFELKTENRNQILRQNLLLKLVNFLQWKP